MLSAADHPSVWRHVSDSVKLSMLPEAKNTIFWRQPTPVTEKAMTPHSSTLAWKIPWTEEPGRLQSMGSLSQTRLSDFTFTFHFHALEKEIAPHSSVLAWRIPGTAEPGRLWGHTESDRTDAT